MKPAEGANSVGPMHSQPTRNASASGSGYRLQATPKRPEVKR